MLKKIQALFFQSLPLPQIRTFSLGLKGCAYDEKSAYHERAQYLLFRCGERYPSRYNILWQDYKWFKPVSLKCSISRDNPRQRDLEISQNNLCRSHRSLGITLRNVDYFLYSQLSVQTSKLVRTLIKTDFYFLWSKFLKQKMFIFFV